MAKEKATRKAAANKEVKPASVEPEMAEGKAVQEPVKQAQMSAKPAHESPVPAQEQEKTTPAVSSEATKPETVQEIAKTAPEAQAKPEPAKAEGKAAAKKEPDPSREFVDSIMTEMNLKGATKKRLIKMLGEQYNFDRQKVLFKLKRALITERYAEASAAAGGH